MLLIFGAGINAAIIKLRCPRCGTVQARARGPWNKRYECKKCRVVFSRQEGERALADARDKLR